MKKNRKNEEKVQKKMWKNYNMKNYNETMKRARNKCKKRQNNKKQ